MNGRKGIRFYSGLILFLILARTASINKPISLYVPEDFKRVGVIIAREYGLALTTYKADADFELSGIDGKLIGYEPIALYQNVAGQTFWVPYLEKSLTHQTLSVEGLYPYEKGYPFKREIRLNRLPKPFLQQLWSGSRRKSVKDLEKKIEFNLKPLHLVLVGDIMLGRKVGDFIQKNSPEYPFLNVIELIKKADIAFANLETPTCLTGEFINLFRAHPDSIAGLKAAGIDVVSLANNHALDYHLECLQETWERLGTEGITQVGSGMNLKEATDGVVIRAKNLLVGFLAYTETWFLYSRAGIDWVASNYPGVAPMYKELIIKDVKRMKEEADLVIVSLHWGIEYSQTVTKLEEDLAKSIIDAGGDVVLGHHPHVVKPWIIYKGKPIFYSVGNFIFDPLIPPLTEQGLLVELIYFGGLKDIRITPTIIKDCQVNLTKLPSPLPDAIIN